MRSAVAALVQAALEAEMTEAIGAAQSERTDTRLAYRSGDDSRSLITRVGSLELRAPQDRMGRFSTELFERYQRPEKALVGTLAQMSVPGVSTRKCLPRRRCFVPKDWRDSARLWQTIEWLRRQLRPDEAQFVPQEGPARAPRPRECGGAARGRGLWTHRGERLPDATAAPQPTAQGECRLMDLKLHANATTTPRTRTYLQNSHATNAALARELGIHSRTVTALLCALREKRARSRAAQGRRRIRPGRGETRA